MASGVSLCTGLIRSQREVSVAGFLLLRFFFSVVLYPGYLLSSANLSVNTLEIFPEVIFQVGSKSDKVDKEG